MDRSPNSDSEESESVRQETARSSEETTFIAMSNEDKKKFTKPQVSKGSPARKTTKKVMLSSSDEDFVDGNEVKIENPVMKKSTSNITLSKISQVNLIDKPLPKVSSRHSSNPGTPENLSRVPSPRTQLPAWKDDHPKSPMHSGIELSHFNAEGRSMSFVSNEVPFDQTSLNISNVLDSDKMSINSVGTQSLGNYSITFSSYNPSTQTTPRTTPVEDFLEEDEDDSSAGCWNEFLTAFIVVIERLRHYLPYCSSESKLKQQQQQQEAITEGGTVSITWYPPPPEWNVPIDDLSFLPLDKSTSAIKQEWAPSARLESTSDLTESNPLETVGKKK